MCIRVIVVGILVVIAVGVAGCFSSNPKDIEAFLKPHQADVTLDKYVLQPPDEVEIHCVKVPEIHMQRQRIRPDGKISFESLGEIEAAGRTVEEIANSIRGKVVELYKLTDEKLIDVRIVVFRSKVYYVLGQVYIPGPKEYTGRDTVLSAIADAQLNPMAWQERIQVIRPSADKNVRPRIFEVNFDRMAAHGDASKNVMLQEGDIVFVPPTILAAIALKVEEFVRPIGRAFSAVYIVNRAGYGGGGGGGYGGY